MSSPQGLSRLLRLLLRHPNPWFRGSALAALVLFTAMFGLRECQAAPPAAPRGESRPSTNTGYEKLTGARLVEHRNNDGDSFLVHHGGREFELRLYFVDTPEKYLSDRYPEQQAQVAEQAREMGRSIQDTVALGQSARAFVLDLLARQSFTVYTKWERVYDSNRVYGFVELADPDRPGQTVYLCEVLIRQGLGRVHTKGADTPDGRSWKNYQESLVRLQRQPHRSTPRKP